MKLLFILDFSNTPQMPPAPPTMLGYSDMEPPSYAAPIGSKQVNFHLNDDSELIGTANYVPVYTFAVPYQVTSYYIIAVCVKRFIAFFHNATLVYRRKKYSFRDHKNSAVTVRLWSYGKPNKALTFLQK